MTPVERAEAELTRLDLCLPTRDRRPAARATFESIDVDELERVIERASDKWWNNLSDHGPSAGEYRAAAVKAWLVYG